MDVYSWENHLFLWAIYTMAMLVITRGCNTSWLSECQELSRPAIGLDPTDLRFIQLSEAEENAGHHVVHQQNPEPSRETKGFSCFSNQNMRKP
jgi:hypothetical protein